MQLSECKLIELPKIQDPRGNLTFIENERHVPFAIKRVFYLYDVPGGADGELRERRAPGAAVCLRRHARLRGAGERGDDGAGDDVVFGLGANPGEPVQPVVGSAVGFEDDVGPVRWRPRAWCPGR